MSLQLVVGNSGSGKTEYMYRNIVQEAIRNPNKNYLVIVPEQFTLQTQRKLVDLSLNGAIMNIDILSFKRLAYRIFDELGIRDLSILEETGKNLVLRKIAQEKKNELTVLRPNMSRMGYVSELKSLLSEFVQYNIDSEKLKGYINNEKISPLLSAKLSDVLIMYEGFEAFMKDTYITTEELLQVLSRVVEKSEILKNCEIILDEFTGFTPIQNQLLANLFPIVDKIWVALTIDAKEELYQISGMEELFYLPKKTIQKLVQIANECKTEVLEPMILENAAKNRFVNAPALLFMEQNLFRTSNHKYDEASKEIQIASVRSPKDELILVARQINQLVQKEGYRYKEIAVVTGNVDTYANYAEAVFKKYQIPYFVDTTKQILFHPFIEWIRALLEMIQKDFSYDAVFRFLRCGFSGLESCVIDELENYIIATGIRGKQAWKKKWKRLPKGMLEDQLEQLNVARKYLTDLLFPIATLFGRKDLTVEEAVCGIYQLTCQMEIEKQLWEKEQFYLKKGDQGKAKEYEQIYQIVMKLFEKYVSILGKEILSIQEFVEILDAGLDAAEVATIPPGYDSITIGDIERTRLNGIKVLFFVGVNDGIIPKSASRGGIISQYEREVLKQMDIELAPGVREHAFIQRFYLYINLTKPSDYLFISYAQVDSEGKSIRPSYLISTMCRMFPKIEIREWKEMNKLFNSSTLEAAKDYLVYGEKDENWYSLAKWFKGQGNEIYEKILDASFAHYVDDPISKAVAKAIYGSKVEGSVTRLEQFARCAYAHFLKYGLLLRERQISGFAHADMGNIYHAALQRYSMMLENSKTDWFHISDEERSELAGQAFKEAIEEYVELGSYVTAENMHMLQRMQHIFEQTVWALTKQVRKGKFVPKVFEFSFLDAKDMESLHFVFDDQNRLELTGRIDRVDTCVEEGRIYVKIIDYKSGSTQLDLLKLYQGTQLQLVVYMNAAMEQQKREHKQMEVIPGGMLYYHIDDPILEVTEQLTQEEIQQMVLEHLKPDGLVNKEEAIYRAMDKDFEQKSDVIPVALKKNGELSSLSHVATTEEFEVITEYVQNQIHKAGQEIFDGKISINPMMSSSGENSCDYCPYTAVCGIHSRIPGLSYQRGACCEKEDIIEQMKVVNASRKGEKGENGSSVDERTTSSN